MLATSAFDPTFGTGGIVLGTVDTGSGPNLSSVTATAVQADSKILSAGTFKSSNGAVVAIQRTNSDGSLDTSFGTGGQFTVPFPTSGVYALNGPDSLVIQAGGKIDLAFTLASRSGTLLVRNTVVAQLTAAGQLDTTFGTGGEFKLATADDLITTLGVQRNGQVVGVGLRYSSSASVADQEIAIRLTTAGALDTSFNTTGTLVVSLPAKQGVVPIAYTTGGIAIAPNGSIYLGVTDRVFPDYTITTDTAYIARVNTNGTLDTTYGSGGLLALDSAARITLGGIAVQSTGNLIVAGRYGSNFGEGLPFVVRVLPTGVIDPTFRGLPIDPNVVAPTGSPTVSYGSLTAITVGADDRVTVAGQSNVGQILVEQFTASGGMDVSFGQHGRFAFASAAIPGATSTTASITGIALTPANKVVLVGVESGSSGTIKQSLLAQLLPVRVFNPATNDFDGDGKSDIAAELTNLGLYAYRKSSGTGDVVQGFGPTGFGAAIPASGDFDGDGKPDVAVYLPASGTLVYRASTFGRDVQNVFGPTGTGASIPTPGDYLGTGQTLTTVYLPAQGAFAIRSITGAGNVLAPFGPSNSIPAPGDYDGDGVTDLAVYIPSSGTMAFRPSGGGPDASLQFGPAGQGASIPAPGDYDGDGKSDIAIYIPALGTFAIHPSSGAANYLIPFGMSGRFHSVPAPGDYDGDGKTDAAVYLPTLGKFASRPSGGGTDSVQAFGQPGYGATVPTASIPAAQPPTSAGGTSARSVGASSQVEAYFPLTEENLVLLNGSNATRKKTASRTT